MDASDLKDCGDLFSTTGKDVWRLESYFTQPSCTMRNVDTGEVQTFGMGGLTAASFKPLVLK